MGKKEKKKKKKKAKEEEEVEGEKNRVGSPLGLSSERCRWGGRTG